MFDLSGKTALVTGASGGIGGAIVRALHVQGAHVVLSGTREPTLRALADELGAGTSVVVCDLADGAAVDGLFAAAETAAGEVSILVANAGVTRDGLLMRMKDADWDAVLKVNLESYFRLSRSALRGMMKRRAGRIIAITSVVGATGNPGQGNYAAAKAGLVGMTKSLAAEVASRGITANCVAPGFIATAMTDALTEDQRGRITATIPMGRVGTPDEVAACVLFLASEEARYVTGHCLHVNGGLAMI